MLAAEESRSIAEARYLDGRAALSHPAEVVDVPFKSNLPTVRLERYFGPSPTTDPPPSGSARADWAHDDLIARSPSDVGLGSVRRPWAAAALPGTQYPGLPEALGTGAVPPTFATEKLFTPSPVTSPGFASPCQ